MDENAFRETYRALNPHACPFEKAIIICHHACRNAQRIGIGERLVIGCASAAAQEVCLNLLALLRANSAFALGVTDIRLLPHAKELKVQCGGLQGLRLALDLALVEIDDVCGLVAQARERFEGLENLPFSGIVRSIAHFQARHRK